jgi:hypothetical protein
VASVVAVVRVVTRLAVVKPGAVVSNVEVVLSVDVRVVTVSVV